ncbi:MULTISPECIES: hypothetical protein [Bacillus]|uniref:hypothetical protein n=1 Tax=Bacillus TaxID=1386 RepID=UPI00084AFB75|nr:MULTISPECIES: hypothetical protein [Bacillus subtilis group]AOP15104.1 hypothetical protein BL1202_02156 [Bacillus licheniformis]MDE1421481.1 hypothetical protein [Bacillus licheniformis]MDQ9097891.1 hypothetical protein [Bacillus licheniformis]MEC0479100.1 hypothetical protein [Bacillus licheniformis]MEC0492218.1 hypothetical protein [Bacillus licheniformis]
MDINVKIEAPGLADAIHALAEALAGVKVSSVKGAELRDSADVELRDALADALNTKEVVLDSKAAAQETEETPQVETPPTEDVKEEPPTHEVEETPAISKEAVRDKLAALAQEGKQAEVKKLFAKFGAKKLSEVPSEKYAELLKHAEAL